MMMRSFFGLVLFFSVPLAGSLWAASGKLDVWQLDSLVKVFPGTLPARGGKPLPELICARNGHVSLQLAVRATQPVENFSVEVPSLLGPAGKLMVSLQVRQAGYVVVGSNSTETPPEELIGEAPGWYPDPLLPVTSSLPAHRTLPIWITLHLPADAPAGEYQGTVLMRGKQGLLAQRAFRLFVYSAMVPEQRTLKVTNWFVTGDRESRQFFGVSQYSPEWWELLGNLARVMAEHRQNVILTPLDELVQPGMAAGQLEYDFSRFDRWVDTFEKAGALDLIEGGHLLGRAGGSYNEPLTVSVFVEEGGEGKRVTLPPDDPRVEPALVSFLSSLNRHLEEKGWKNKYVQHILDEPHGKEPEAYGRFAGLVRRCLPGVRTLDAIDAAHIPPEVERECDIWVPVLGRFDDKLELLEKRIQSGKEVWFYVCLFPRGKYMNRLIDFPLGKTQLLHWTNFRYNLTGFLHWGWNWWTPEPMKDTQPVINLNETLLPAGDAFIVYPDREHRSVFSSIRLEAMREGIEDYELLRILEKRDKPAAQKIAAEMVPSLTGFVRDPLQFRRIKTELLRALSTPDGGIALGLGKAKGAIVQK